MEGMVIGTRHESLVLLEADDEDARESAGVRVLDLW